MKSKFLNFHSFLFLTTLIFFIALSFLSYRNPTYNSLVFLAIVSSIFVFQLMIVLSDFKNNIQRIAWAMSYLFGFSLAINFSKEWFLLSWKYQLIILIFVIFFVFNLRFISKLKKWILLLMFINNFLFCGYLIFIVVHNFEDAIFFDIAKWLSIYMVLFSGIISISSSKSKLKAENEKT